MKPEQVFIGNIRKCTNYSRYCIDNVDLWIGGPRPERIVKNKDGSTDYLDCTDDLYKERVVLIKTKNGEYVDLEKLNSIFDYFRMYMDSIININYPGRLLMSTLPFRKNSLFVDEQLLEPYYDNQQQISDVSVFQLKKQIKNSTK